MREVSASEFPSGFIFLFSVSCPIKNPYHVWALMKACRLIHDEGAGGEGGREGLYFGI